MTTAAMRDSAALGRCTKRTEGRPLRSDDGLRMLKKRGLPIDKIFGEFTGKEPAGSLGMLCLELLEQQKRDWPILREGYSSLEKCRERRVDCGGLSVIIQHNPGRITSTLAAVGETDVRKRSCFLCRAHLPEEQKGILYRGEYLILCNPMPVFPVHFTIAHLEHRPQAVGGQMQAMLRLMSDFGNAWSILYNGPRCGASAPDHFHFQAVCAGRMPVEQEIARVALPSQGAPARVIARSAVRRMLLIRSSSVQGAEHAFQAFYAGLQQALGTDEEPMMNIIGQYVSNGGERNDSRDGKSAASAAAKLSGSKALPEWRVLVFPRRKHRPDAFFREGNDRIAVSPAVVEMGGLFVTPFERDFQRLDATAVKSIYREVSLESEKLKCALQRY